MVLLLDWVGKDKGKTDFNLNVAKNRSGRTGYIDLEYVPEFYLFRDKPLLEAEPKKERMLYESEKTWTE